VGHVLVIPRAHAREPTELDPEVGDQMFKVATVVAEGLKRSDVKCEEADLILGDRYGVFPLTSPCSSARNPKVQRRGETALNKNTVPFMV